jgi:hypothetical protein
MSEPNFEKGLTQALAEAVADYGKDGPTVSANVRIGTMEINGEPAQIQLCVTTNPDDFLDENGCLQT